MKIKIHLLIFGITILLLVLTINAQAMPVQDQAAASAVMEYMKEGSRHYLNKNYKEAIGHYSKALELEKKQSVLSKTLWYVLIDNLGMSYGITGDLKKAKETFEYGLSKDNRYPLFYYNLACACAEMNDMEGTIVNLKNAFKYRQNMLPGESMPDPAADDSFQRFMRNDRFLTVLNELKKGNNNPKGTIGGRL